MKSLSLTRVLLFVLTFLGCSSVAVQSAGAAFRGMRAADPMLTGHSYPASLNALTPSVFPLGTASPPLAYYYLPFLLKNRLGRDYYIATTGSDTSGDGSAVNPWRTLAKGVSVLNPGDTLYLKSGTYLQTSTLRIARSGTAVAWITISTAPGEPSLAIISGDTNGNGAADATDTPGPNGYHLVDLAGSYLNFQNLEVAYSGKFGISSHGTGDRIANSKIHDTWSAGIWAWAPSNIIENNTVWRADDSNYCGGASGSRECNGNWEGAIAWGDTSPPGNKSPNTVVRHNTVFNNSGEGLLCMQTDYATIEDNVVYDNWAMNIDLDQCSNTTVRRNLTYYTSDIRWWRGVTYPATNIMLSNEGEGGYTVIGHDIQIINNIMIGAGEGLMYWGEADVLDSALINVLIANNTIISDGNIAAFYIEDPGPYGSHSNTRIVNNLILKSSGLMATVSTIEGLSFDHNLWSRTPPANVSSPTDVVGNPLLVDPYHARLPGAVLPDWFELTLGSPAIDHGTALSSVTEDYFGVPRSMLPDIGADEYQ